MPTEAKTPGPLSGPNRLTQVYSVSARLFAQRSYSGTSIRDIADALGIRAPSLYTYFESKQKILDGLVLTCVEDMRTTLREALERSDDPREQIVRGTEEQVRFRIHNADAWITAWRETLHLSPDVRLRTLAARDEQYDLWDAAITRGVADGVFVTPDPALSARMVMDLCNYVHIRYFYVEQQMSESDFAYKYGVAALRMLTP